MTTSRAGLAKTFPTQLTFRTSFRSRALPRATTAVARGGHILLLRPFGERVFDTGEDEGMHIVDVREPFANDARLIGATCLHFPYESMQRRPATHAETDDLGKKIWRERVIVATIAGFADALGDA